MIDPFETEMLFCAHFNSKGHRRKLGNRVASPNGLFKLNETFFFLCFFVFLIYRKNNKYTQKVKNMKKKTAKKEESKDFQNDYV